MPKERGICMTGPNALAIRERRKTQTRRIFKRKPDDNSVVYHVDGDGNWIGWYPDRPALAEFTLKAYPKGSGKGIKCRWGVPGDLLYIREACWMWGAWSKNGLTKTGRQRWRFRPRGLCVVYEHPQVTAKRDGSIGWVYRHARYMPKRMARTWTEITDVRVQQVQEITIWDAIEEGVKLGMVSLDGSKLLIDSMACPPHVKYDWIGIWDSIHGPGAWERNDWVFVITFKRIQ